MLICKNDVFSYLYDTIVLVFIALFIVPYLDDRAFLFLYGRLRLDGGRALRWTVLRLASADL